MADSTEYFIERRRKATEEAFTLLEKAMERSKDVYGMTPADIAMALFALQMLARQQQDMITLLVSHPSLKPRKPWYKRWFTN